jgi:hypothetical protein
MKTMSYAQELYEIRVRFRNGVTQVKSHILVVRKAASRLAQHPIDSTIEREIEHLRKQMQDIRDDAEDALSLLDGILERA